ncbi:unnamed protein product [Protopolystoma xenopodis]|uniref:Uncharacterized protein n=1 Tax=Protopolystoma xenopodis TaxID=117903 RepID=A0A3S5BP91_9PLAT|nr:unnamed protein product [Protopolystoma xenopodis]
MATSYSKTTSPLSPVIKDGSIKNPPAAAFITVPSLPPNSAPSVSAPPNLQAFPTSSSPSSFSDQSISILPSQSSLVESQSTPSPSLKTASADVYPPATSLSELPHKNIYKEGVMPPLSSSHYSPALSHTTSFLSFSLSPSSSSSSTSSREVQFAAAPGSSGHASTEPSRPFGLVTGPWLAPSALAGESRFVDLQMRAMLQWIASAIASDSINSVASPAVGPTQQPHELHQRQNDQPNAGGQSELELEAEPNGDRENDGPSSRKVMDRKLKTPHMKIRTEEIIDCQSHPISDALSSTCFPNTNCPPQLNPNIPSFQLSTIIDPEIYHEENLSTSSFVSATALPSDILRHANVPSKTEISVNATSLDMINCVSDSTTPTTTTFSTIPIRPSSPKSIPSTLSGTSTISATPKANELSLLIKPSTYLTTIKTKETASTSPHSTSTITTGAISFTNKTISTTLSPRSIVIPDDITNSGNNIKTSTIDSTPETTLIPPPNLITMKIASQTISPLPNVLNTIKTETADIAACSNASNITKLTTTKKAILIKAPVKIAALNTIRTCSASTKGTTLSQGQNYATAKLTPSTFSTTSTTSSISPTDTLGPESPISTIVTSPITTRTDLINPSTETVPVFGSINSTIPPTSVSTATTNAIANNSSQAAPRLHALPRQAESRIGQRSYISPIVYCIQEDSQAQELASIVALVTKADLSAGELLAMVLDYAETRRAAGHCPLLPRPSHNNPVSAATTDFSSRTATACPKSNLKSGPTLFAYLTERLDRRSTFASSKL